MTLIDLVLDSLSAPESRSRAPWPRRGGAQGACWCPIVQLELWNGANGDHEKRVLRNFSAVLPDLPINEEVRNAACDIARRARTLGVTVPAIDLVIAACAHVHDATIESADDLSSCSTASPNECGRHHDDHQIGEAPG